MNNEYQQTCNMRDLQTVSNVSSSVDLVEWPGISKAAAPYVVDDFQRVGIVFAVLMHPHG